MDSIINRTFWPSEFRNSSNPTKEFTDLCSGGCLKEAFVKFRSQIWSDPYLLFSHLVRGCVRTKNLILGKQIHSLIVTSGCSSLLIIPNLLLNMYTKLGRLKDSLALFAVMPTKNIISCNILVSAYVQNGHLEAARKMFDSMPERSECTWNTLLAGLTRYECNEEALCLFSEMQMAGFSPDSVTLSSALRACSNLKALGKGRQFHTYVVKSGNESDVVVESSLAHMYMKSNCLEDGQRILNSFPFHTDTIACNILISGNADNGFLEGSLEQYNTLKGAGFKPNSVTFFILLSTCAELATLGQGQQIHAGAIKAGSISYELVICSLIRMYSKCGLVGGSVQAFLEYEGPLNLKLCNSMISAHGFHGQVSEAIDLFERMENEGVEVNHVTFLSLLYACSHCRLKEKGTELFYLMVDKYGLEPKLEHYTCMVDLLGRCGYLDDAEAMIRSMHVKDDAVIWKTLLFACNSHGNRSMAKRMAEQVLKHDPLDSTSYVILSNIHASTKRWGSVTNVRETMKKRGVRTEPAVSWLEVKNEVHVFNLGEKCHPNSLEIGEYLEELILELKSWGYVPDTSSVLHDTEIEEKEHNLAHHSEKLAVAFALMTTPADAPIRIMKNIRVCGDCHVAFKCISGVKKREIIVRDASRFHHFKHGKCSCGDYW